MNLKKLRKAAKMSQFDVAKHLNVSVGAVRVWDCGGGWPNKENLQKLNLLFGCDVLKSE